jgi:hypothetical protein
MHFVPLNIDRRHKHPLLARVDEALRPKLLRYSWRFHPRALSVTLPGKGLELGGKLASLTLPQMVLGITQNIRHLNGDILDARRENLVPYEYGNITPIPPGRAFNTTPEYFEALRQLAANIEYFQAESKSHRSIFSIAETQKILDFVKNDCAGIVMETCAGLVSLRLKVEVKPQTLRNMIFGITCRVPGYDYEALKATRPKNGRQPSRIS